MVNSDILRIWGHTVSVGYVRSSSVRVLLRQTRKKGESFLAPAQHAKRVCSQQKAGHGSGVGHRSPDERALMRE